MTRLFGIESGREYGRLVLVEADRDEWGADIVDVIVDLLRAECRDRKSANGVRIVFSSEQYRLSRGFRVSQVTDFFDMEKLESMARDKAMRGVTAKLGRRRAERLWQLDHDYWMRTDGHLPCVSHESAEGLTLSGAFGP